MGSRLEGSDGRHSGVSHRPKLIILGLALAVDMLGSGLLLPVSLLYFTEVTGLRLGTVGPLLSLAALASLPVPVIVGHVADRTRPLSRVLAAQLLQGAAYAAYALVNGPITLLAAAIAAARRVRRGWARCSAGSRSPTGGTSRWST